MEDTLARRSLGLKLPTGGSGSGEKKYPPIVARILTLDKLFANLSYFFDDHKNNIPYFLENINARLAKMKASKSPAQATFSAEYGKQMGPAQIDATDYAAKNSELKQAIKSYKVDLLKRLREVAVATNKGAPYREISPHLDAAYRTIKEMKDKFDRQEVNIKHLENRLSKIYEEINKLMIGFENNKLLTAPEGQLGQP
jgi:hypothetical protein